jgi:hypothetical protein
MIVLALPIPVRDPAHATDAPAEPITSDAASANEVAAPASKSRTPAAHFAAALDAALSRGDATRAAELLTTSEPALRVDGYRRLGMVLRSVVTARRVLDELPVDARLAACRELSLQPRWRTVTCAQLSALHHDETTRAAVDVLLDDLARSSDLAPLVERVRSSRPPARPAPMNRSI